MTRTSIEPSVEALCLSSVYEIRDLVRSMLLFALESQPQCKFHRSLRWEVKPPVEALHHLFQLNDVLLTPVSHQGNISAFISLSRNTRTYRAMLS
jgi:hypothetical protein